MDEDPKRLETDSDRMTVWHLVNAQGDPFPIWLRVYVVFMALSVTGFSIYWLAGGQPLR